MTKTPNSDAGTSQPDLPHQAHAIAQIQERADAYEKEGGHALIVQMLRSYANLLGQSASPADVRAAFELWARRLGGLDLRKAVSPEFGGIPSSLRGLCPATYYSDETESAWRAWANKPPQMVQHPPETQLQIERAVHMLINAGTVGIQPFNEDGSPTPNRAVVLDIAKRLHGPNFEETFSTQLSGRL